MRRFVPLGRTRPGRPFYAGHEVELLIDGGPYYRRVLADLRAAERYIFIETYILRSDDTGWALVGALIEAAARGVEVALVYDAFGSDDLADDMVQAIDGAGIKRLAFRPLSFSKWSWPWSRRNHRKLVLVDGCVGIVGGLNIGDEYAESDLGEKGWRDTAVRVVGPAVLQLDQLFRHLWWVEKGPELHTGLRGRPPPISGGMAVRFVANFARGERALIRRAYEVAVMSAQSRVQIMNAYFFPHRTLRRALEDAARRGVKVQLIIAGNTDVKPAIYAARSLYSRLLRAGVEIYEWHERVLHAKTAVVDGEWTTIGSSNLDPFSSFVNLELNAGIFSRSFGMQVSQQFEDDLARCIRVDPEQWKKRPLFDRVLELGFRWFTKRY